MKFIAHRGNTEGSEPSRENTIAYIQESLDKGYDVEVDLIYSGEELYLGHDEPQEIVSVSFLKSPRIWCHAKTSDTYLYLMDVGITNVFLQDDEDIVLTNKGYLWHHSRCSCFSKTSIAVCTQYDYTFLDNYPNVAGLCSDYVKSYRDSYTGELTSKVPDCPFDLLVLDIDGVMTDGTKTYDQDSKVISKNYADRDFTAIKRFKAKGINVCLLSGDSTVNEEMAKSRNIAFYCSKGKEKSEYLLTLSADFNTPIERISYVGDDFYDLGIIRKLNYTYCPSDAAKCVKEACLEVLNTPGGKGVVAELYEKYLEVPNPPLIEDNNLGLKV